MSKLSKLNSIKIVITVEPKKSKFIDIEEAQDMIPKFQKTKLLLKNYKSQTTSFFNDSLKFTTINFQKHFRIFKLSHQFIVDSEKPFFQFEIEFDSTLKSDTNNDYYINFIFDLNDLKPKENKEILMDLKRFNKDGNVYVKRNIVTPYYRKRKSTFKKLFHYFK